MYADGEGGFHHVGVLADDYDGERQRLARPGIRDSERSSALTVRQLSTSTPERRSGAYTEIHSTPERIMTTFERWKAAHQEWDGVTEPLPRPTATPPDAGAAVVQGRASMVTVPGVGVDRDRSAIGNDVGCIGNRHHTRHAEFA